MCLKAEALQREATVQKDYISQTGHSSFFCSYPLQFVHLRVFQLLTTGLCQHHSIFLVHLLVKLPAFHTNL